MNTTQLSYWTDSDYDFKTQSIRLLVNSRFLISVNNRNVNAIMTAFEDDSVLSIQFPVQEMVPQEVVSVHTVDLWHEEAEVEMYNYEFPPKSWSAPLEDFHVGEPTEVLITFADLSEKRMLANVFWEHYALEGMLLKSSR